MARSYAADQMRIVQFGAESRRSARAGGAAQEAKGRITLAQLAASGRHVVVQCGRCPNRRLSTTTDLDLAMDMPVNVDTYKIVELIVLV